jgi:hypothetical protein
MPSTLNRGALAPYSVRLQNGQSKAKMGLADYGQILNKTLRDSGTSKWTPGTRGVSIVHYYNGGDIAGPTVEAHVDLAKTACKCSTNHIAEIY